MESCENFILLFFYFLEQWSLKFYPKISAVNIAWELVKNVNFQVLTVDLMSQN